MAFLDSWIQYFLVAGLCWFAWRYTRGRNSVVSILDNLPGPPPQSFWKGNLFQFLNRDGAGFHDDISQNYGPVVKLHSLFGGTMLYVYDPKALHSIILKDHDLYDEPDAFIKVNLLIHGPGVISTLGAQHRRQRKMLNPVFSVNHMRHMLPTFYNIVHKLRDAIAARVTDDPREIDMLHWMGRTALEIIGQGGLGYSFDTLIDDKDDAYGFAMKSLAPTLQELFLLFPFLPLVYGIGPVWLQMFLLDIFPHRSVRKAKKIVDILTARSTKIYNAKKAALLQGDEAVVRQVGEGKDIMSILMKANLHASEEDKLPENEVIAQMSTLLFAATDTTSNTTARILDLLAQHQDIQEKLRQEVLDAQAGEFTPYDQLNQLPYLDAVLRETLRLYPGLTLLSRSPREDIVLPLSEPIQGLDGKAIHEIPLQKGTEVFLGILGSNTNEALWGDDAYEWKPERWLAPLPKAVSEARIPGVYSSLMTFLGGNKSCLGFKFSEMEMKVILAVLLSKFSFEPVKEPIVWNVAGIWYPTVGKGDEPRMPMRVRLLQSVDK